MTQSMKDDIEQFRVSQLPELGKVPSFGEAIRMLVQRGLDEAIENDRPKA